MLKAMDRRAVLKGTGVCLGLPFLEAMQPTLHASDSKNPKRFVAVTQSLGTIHDTWFPKETGFNYTMPRVLACLKEHQKDLTIFSNIDHGLKGGHHAESGVLNGVKNTDATRSPFGAESIDQTISKYIGNETRFCSLHLWGNGQKLTSSCSRSGSMLPSSAFVPSELFKMLFINGTKEEIQQTKQNINEGKSILDFVLLEAKSMNRNLGKADQDKLDDYFTAIRSSEKKLANRNKWVDQTKPVVDQKAYKKIMDGSMDSVGVEKMLEAWVDLVHLAVATDSTRSLTLTVPMQMGIWQVPNVSKDAHYYSHHGKEESKKEAFRSIETKILTEFNRMLQKFKSDIQPNGQSLLDSTTLVYTSGLSNGSTHSNKNLPIVIAGGNKKHGQHIDNNYKYSLNSLYYSLLKSYAPEAQSFNGATKEHNWQEVSA